jgi:hypothetical protein
MEKIALSTGIEYSSITFISKCLEVAKEWILMKIKQTNKRIFKIMALHKVKLHFHIQPTLKCTTLASKLDNQKLLGITHCLFSLLFIFLPFLDKSIYAPQCTFCIGIINFGNSVHINYVRFDIFILEFKIAICYCTNQLEIYLCWKFTIDFIAFYSAYFYPWPRYFDTFG